MTLAVSIPWKGISTSISNDLTPEQMLVKSGLNWKVVLKQAHIVIKEKRVQIPRKGLVRESDGYVLSVVSPGWNPVQNAEAFAFFNDFVAAGDMEMQTAGSLKNGELVWALARIKEDSFEAVKGDVIGNYLLFTNPHRYGQRCSVAQIALRLVCLNGLVMPMTTKIVNFDHRVKFDPDRVKEALGIARVQLEKYKESAKFLASKSYTVEAMQEYFNEMFPRTSDAKGKGEKSKNFARALEVVETQPGANFAKGSWWQPFNAVTYILDHEHGKTQDNRLESNWYGYGAKQKNIALNRAVEFASA